MKTIILTGAAGFICSHLADKLHKEGYRLLVIDKLTYAGNLDNLNNVRSNIHKLILDVASPRTWEIVREYTQNQEIECVIHGAAESHVDNSIRSSEPFIHSNIQGTYQVLEFCREFNYSLINFLTDENFGSYGINYLNEANEESPYNPRNPYSSTKASAGCLAKAWQATYQLRISQVYPSNNFGPRQHREKLIPKTIHHVLNNEVVPLYGGETPERDWLYVEDCVDGIYSIIENKLYGEDFCISGENYYKNIEIVQKIIKILENKGYSGGKYDILAPDRQGHDVGYRISCEKLKKMTNWTQKCKKNVNFDEFLEKTAEYYL